MTQVTPIRDLRAYLSPEQVERLIAATSNLRDALLVRIPWRSGIRVSELIGITVPDIDFDNRAIVIKVQKMRKRDGKAIERRRVVPIDQGTLDMVREYLEWRKQFPYKGELLFPITRQRVDQIFWKLGRRAGIKGLHPHSLRHLLATTWASKGLDTKKLQLLMGHANISTTMEYVDSNFEQLRSEYEKLWESKEDEGKKTKD